MVDQFNVLTLNLFERFVTLRPTRDRDINNVTPWLNREIERAILERDVAFRSWINDQCPANREIYRSARKYATQMIKAAKRRYFYNKLSPNIGTKKLWSILKTAGFIPSGSSSVIPNLTPKILYITYQI